MWLLPPFSNTGVVISEEEQILSNVDFHNDLRVVCDWLAFTFKDFAKPQDVMELFGFDISDFSVCNGMNGYKCSYRHSLYPVAILFDGSENMGIHVRVSGSAVPFVLESYKTTLLRSTPWGDAYELFEDSPSALLRDFFRCIVEHGGSGTRLDLAVDDIGCNYYSVDDVREICDSDRCCTRFRKYRQDVEKDFHGDTSGNTVYIGKRQSDVFLRVYDKQLEQNSKGESVSYPWVRWELELKQERARKAIELLISGCELGELTMGILSNYFRVIVRDNDNVSRCSTDSLWERFMAGVSKLKLSDTKVLKSLEKTKRWIVRGVMPSISAIAAAEGGDLGFIFNNLESSLYRNKRPVLDMVFASNPALKEALLI